MYRKSTFEMIGNAFSSSFFKQLLLFGLLIISVFAAAIIVFPGLSTNIAAVLAASEVEDGPFYMIFIILMTDIKSFILIGVIMMICAMFVSPIMCGASAGLNDYSFKEKSFSLSNAFGLAFRNYGRLLGTYVLYVLIVVGTLGIFAYFMYNFMHEWSHIYSENYMVPVMTAWIALILFIFGGIIFSPFIGIYEKKGGFRSIGGSFVLFIKGGFIYNALQLLIGAAIWGVIVILPTYGVLLSLCEPGTSIDYLLYVIDVPGNSPLLWVVMILSWTIATLFMFDYSQAVFFGASRRKTVSEAKKRKKAADEKERMEYESYRNSIRRRQTGNYR